MGRILGEERLAGEKAMRRTLCRESVNEVMFSMGKSCWDKFGQDDKKILGKTFLHIVELESRNVSEDEKCSEVNWFQDIASQGDTSDDIWNFLWHIISSSTLSAMVMKSLCLLLEEWKNEECQMGSGRNFIMSTAILYHLSFYVTVENRTLLEQACKDAAGDQRQRFNDTPRKTSFAYCDKTGNHNVLNKILFFATLAGVSSVVKKVLEWGAQQQANIFLEDLYTTRYYAILFPMKEIVRSLLDNCDSKEQFANGADKDGMTALHLACGSYEGRADVSICRMNGIRGKPDVADNRGRLPLHYAVERGNEDIVDVLIGEGNSDTVRSSQDWANMVTRKDKDGATPLDVAVKKNNIKLMVKLLSISQQALDA